jgi:hypothetical protein
MSENYLHIKKDEAGNEIARYPVKVETEKVDVNELYIEAGDLAGIISDRYRGKLWQAIEDGSKFSKPLLYFIVMIKKDPIDKQKIHIKLTISDKGLPNKMYEGTDYWRYDYKIGELKLIWSIPHKSSMAMYLKDPHRFDPQLIKWINDFIKQEGLDIKKLESKKVKIL